jgi:serine/threonine protein kinase
MKDFLLLKEAELNIQHYSEECLIQDQHHLQVVLNNWRLKKDELIANLFKEDKREVISSFNKFYNELKNKDSKDPPKYYYKTVPQTSYIKWDPDEYKQFWNRFGYAFLPQLIDVITFDSYMELKMKYIDGQRPHDIEKSITQRFNFGLLIQYISNKIIPSFYEWSRLTEQEGKYRYGKIFIHSDITPNNFLITKKGKIWLIDIDSICWRTFEEIQEISYEKTFI